ncbi:hypothetical protein HAX54_022421, partial [Datura stramonium]|nr:hypothetical protein [Datura stramonium]
GSPSKNDLVARIQIVPLHPIDTPSGVSFYIYYIGLVMGNIESHYSGTGTLKLNNHYLYYSGLANYFGTSRAMYRL